jgi:hypothetical protein
MKISKATWHGENPESATLADGAIEPPSFSWGLDEKENEFGEVELTIGDYKVTLTSAEVLEIIEGLEMIGIRVGKAD